MHAVVLLIAMAISGLSTVSGQLDSGLRLGAINAEGLVVGQGGRVGNVSLGRFSTIVKPVSVPGAPRISHQPVTYTVGQNEDLNGIAGHFGVSVNEIRWSNSGLTTTDAVHAGDKLVIPPVHGVVVTIKSGDSIGSIADAYKVDPASIADFNYIWDPTDLIPGMVVVIPGGQGPSFAPAYVPPPPPRTYYSGAASAASVGGPNGSLSGAGFPWGYCTYYVATRRPIPWRGNAWEWWPNARAMGYAEGSTPRPGAVMVTWESGYGHVAYVEQVNPDGSWRVSEMNFVGFGIVSQRTIRPGTIPLVGFIY